MPEEPSDGGPIYRYFQLGMDQLQWSDIAVLTDIAAELAEPANPSRKQRYFLGWLAYEKGSLADRYDQPDLAVEYLDEACQHWETTNPTPSPFHDIMRYRAIAMARLHKQILTARFSAELTADIDLQETRQYFGQLAWEACQLAHENDVTGFKFRGLASEILFAGVMLGRSETSPRNFIPYVASPRVESPPGSSLVFNRPPKQPLSAYDVVLQTYAANWRPQRKYNIQIKTQTSSGGQNHDRSVIFIAADKHMAIRPERALEAAKTLASTDLTEEMRQARINHMASGVLNTLGEVA